MWQEIDWESIPSREDGVPLFEWARSKLSNLGFESIEVVAHKNDIYYRIIITCLINERQRGRYAIFSFYPDVCSEIWNGTEEHKEIMLAKFIPYIREKTEELLNYAIEAFNFYKSETEEGDK